MRTAGIREIKARLSEYLRRVQAGEVILVTDRGRVVAEIRKFGGAEGNGDLPSGLVDLAARGAARLGSPNDRSRYPKLARLVPDGTASELLAADRGER